MQGILKKLIQNTPDMEALRDTYVFKIIPMLNPDGVIHGNYWTSLSGTDLNWRWKMPNKDLYPTVHEAKSLAKKLWNERDMVLYVDLHGHSWKKDSFMYGNSFHGWLFPFLMSKVIPDFNFSNCTFVPSKDKDRTAWVAMWKELNDHCDNIGWGT